MILIDFRVDCLTYSLEFIEYCRFQNRLIIFDAVFLSHSVSSYLHPEGYACMAVIVIVHNNTNIDLVECTLNLQINVKMNAAYILHDRKMGEMGDSKLRYRYTGN